MALLLDALFYLSILNVATTLVIFALLSYAALITRRLIDISPSPSLPLSSSAPSPEPRAASTLPSVSLIAPARNEERNIERAVRSLVQLDYPSLEITIVNDRSTDNTARILDALAVEFPQLNVVHLTDLPPGWLGKNHALQLGADRSHGDWLLFTDADIVFEPTALRRAIRYCQENRVDHLAATPDTRMPSWLLQSFVVTFAIYFSIFVRIWSIRNPNSTAHIGIGAFNLVRASVYRAVGGHHPIRMRPDDDLKLGKIIKLAGYRQDVVNGAGMIAVDWYGSIGEMIRGLEKNSFSATEYSIGLTVFSSLLSLLFNVWPFLAIFLVNSPTRWVYLANCLTLWCMAIITAFGMNARLSTSLGFPLGVLLLVYVQWRTMLLNFYQNGIRWRDTHYTLAELRANKV
jgi:cellulose synthase/poly-beta-1,6-N-acetylglucosamine synthase-like glycosyltransferase